MNRNTWYWIIGIVVVIAIIVAIVLMTQPPPANVVAPAGDGPAATDVDTPG